MLVRRLVSASRYLALVAIVGILVGASGLLFYELIVIADAVIDTVQANALSPKIAKVLAVGMIEAIDVFLIAIVAQNISVGLYLLFIDETLPVPSWLKINNLDDLKNQLVSSVIAVLAVLFMREAVAWDGQRDLFGFGAALALVIVALTGYLFVKKGKS